MSLPNLLAQARLDQGTVFFILMAILFVAIGIHEYCHAKFADLAGDPTPRIYGRVTLNLFNHFDPIGALMIVFTSLTGFGIGWGRPVPMDPSKMRNPKWDHFIAVLAGPLSNLAQAVVYAFAFHIFRITLGEAAAAPLMIICTLGAIVNISLFLFNLLPLGPLDGMWILGTFLPDGTRDKWTWWNLRTGTWVFLGLVLGSQLVNFPFLRIILYVPSEFLTRLLGLPRLF